jgi:UDPglucose 6-dehydrogenase
MDISVIGLGKLGLCTAACFAAKGHRVAAYDINPEIIDALKERRNPITETGLDDLLAKAWPHLAIADQMETVVDQAEITLIIVPTPSLADGRFSNEYVEAVLQMLSPALKQKKGFHVVTVVSTVMPGTCSQQFKPMIEEWTGKRCGVDFGLAYNPEFIALGSVIRDFLNPDMVLIGASDNKSAAMLHELYTTTCDNRPAIRMMSLINAEITKLSLNCFLTLKISFANELASICERMKGSDIDVVTAAIGSDSRIGGKYLKAGLGFGGPCFPRDNLAFQNFATNVGRPYRIGPVVMEINDDVVHRLLIMVKKAAPPAARIAVLGLAYKPGTPVVEQSQPVILANALLGGGYEVAVHDPQALPSARDILDRRIDCCSDPYDCVRNARLILLMTPWPEYASMDFDRVRDLAAPDAVLIDCWRSLDTSRTVGMRIIPFGYPEAREI